MHMSIHYVDYVCMRFWICGQNKAVVTHGLDRETLKLACICCLRKHAISDYISMFVLLAVPTPR